MKAVCKASSGPSCRQEIPDGLPGLLSTVLLIVFLGNIASGPWHSLVQLLRALGWGLLDCIPGVS